MANKFTLTSALRKASGRACAYCKRPMDANCPHLMPTRDHVHPRSKGGQETVWACFTCNHMKADMTLVEWQRFMAACPRWWVGFKCVKPKKIVSGQLAIIPYAESMMILRHGKEYWRRWKAQQAGLIAGRDG